MKRLKERGQRERRFRAEKMRFAQAVGEVIWQQLPASLHAEVKKRRIRPATAKMVTAQLPKINIFSLMQVSGANDSSASGSAAHFTSRNEDTIIMSEAPMLTSAGLIWRRGWDSNPRTG